MRKKYEYRSKIEYRECRDCIDTTTGEYFECKGFHCCVSKFDSIYTVIELTTGLVFTRVKDAKSIKEAKEKFCLLIETKSSRDLLEIQNYCSKYTQNHGVLNGWVLSR